MAWKETKVEDQRKEFIVALLKNEFSVSSLCQRFGISRKTGYKWIERFHKDGFDGLKDHSRARHTQKQKIEEHIISQILDLKSEHSDWGPKKILGHLEEHYQDEIWPCRTTIHKIFQEHNLIIPRKYRRRFPAKTNPLSHCQQPNDIWSIDFKGWFKTRDHVKCDPLTLVDAHSRFILYCQKLSNNTVDCVWDVLSKSFYEYGLPLILRHDNGPPFATSGAGRLSRLSVKLIKAGVTPEWIDPGKPYQNGRHERMHLTLKQEGIYPLKLSLEEQQKKFEDFLKYYNYVRPHEALGQKTPSTLYLPSNRIWTGNFQEVEYPSGYEIKRVRAGGLVSWRGEDIFVGKVLAEEHLGITLNEKGLWSVFFGPVLLGEIDDEKKFIQPQTKTRINSKYKISTY